MSSIVDVVEARIALANARKQEVYHALVRALADEEEVNATVVMEDVVAAGRTLDDLRADVDLLLRRRQLAAMLGTLPEIERARTAAISRVESLTAERDATVARLDLKIRAAEAEVENATRQARQAKDARAELLKTAPEELKSHIQELTAAHAKAIAEVERLRAEVARLDGIIGRALPEQRDETRNPYSTPLLAERGRRDERKKIEEAEWVRDNASSRRVIIARALATAESQAAALTSDLTAARDALLQP